MKIDLSLVAVPNQVPSDIHAALLQMGPVVDPASTAVLYTPLHERAPIAGISTQRDVCYGPDARHLLDIFKNDDAPTGGPVLLFVHGGAFMRGDRRIGDSPFNDNIAVWAARQGSLGINMTYRLAPAYGWPSAQHDIRRALAWLHAHVARWGGDAKRIILMGHSAGAAHVAQYLACPQFHLDTGPGIKGAVLMSGIFDPATAEHNLPLRAYFGDDVSRYPGMSAIDGLVASKVPQLYAYAELDPDDFVRQAGQVGVAMQQSGKKQPIYRLNGHSHMSEVYSINTADDAFTKLLQDFVVSSAGGPSIAV